MDISGFSPAWILAIFEATMVVQILCNGWGSSSMEVLIQHLVQHGVQFHTLMPASVPIPDNIIKLNEVPPSFIPLPHMMKPMVDAEDYVHYVKFHTDILQSQHRRAAYQMGGIVWHLAMEMTADIHDIVDGILDGPMDMGLSQVNYFIINKEKYYDDAIPYTIVDAICGCHGPNGSEYF